MSNLLEGMENLFIQYAGEDESNNQLLTFLDVIPVLLVAIFLTAVWGFFILLWIFSVHFLWNRESYWKWEKRLQDIHPTLNRLSLNLWTVSRDYILECFPPKNFCPEKYPPPIPEITKGALSESTFVKSNKKCSIIKKCSINTK